jgi:alpha-1,3-mannosyltransferase
MVGGLENTVASLVLALRELGIDGSIVTLDRNFRKRDEALPAKAEFHGIPISRIPFTGSTKYPLAPAVLKHLRGADIVHVHAIDFFFDFLALTRPIHHKPLIASTHGGFFHTSYAQRLKHVYFQTVTRSSALAYAKIIGSSENDAATFARIAPRNTVAIENGVDVDKWRDSASREPVETLLALGRFSSNKALPDLIALIAALGPPWRLLIAGHDSDLTAGQLQGMAKAMNVEDRVELHVGLEGDAFRGLLNRASYIASASRFEGFGLTAIEGLSAGLTPVLNDIPPFRRVVAQTGLGLILDMSAPVEAANQLRRFHDPDPARYLQRREAAIMSSKSYGWSNVADRFAEVYAATAR